VKLNGPKAGNKKITLNMVFTDTGEKATLELVNGSLNHSLDKTAAAPVIGEFAFSAA
jgi:alkyl sulfatase BDS1-like metallo-beta-lactamase superfamily hydrolase